VQSAQPERKDSSVSGGKRERGGVKSLLKGESLRRIRLVKKKPEKKKREKKTKKQHGTMLREKQQLIMKE